jgi:hypothetical protein
MLNLINKIGKIMPIMTATLIVYGGIVTNANQKINAKEIDLNSLCPKFPQNSRCLDYDYSSVKPEQTKLKLERDSLCTKFPQNSYCLQAPKQVIKIQLDRSGEKDEWIQIEKQDRKIKVKHSTQVKDGLVSGIFDGALGFVPVPLPFVEANKYNWKDHRVTKITFQPDGCKLDNCTITGSNTLTLPEKTNIYSGVLTIEYQEEELKRSLAFRVPSDAETETINSITINTPNPNTGARVKQQANYSYQH